MKLIIAIVNSDNEYELTGSLNRNGFMVTKLASTGGFLKRGNSTLFIGVEKEKVEEVLEIIRKICRTHIETNYTFMQRDPSVGLSTPYPSPSITGGATLFVLDVENYG